MLVFGRRDELMKTLHERYEEYLKRQQVSTENIQKSLYMIRVIYYEVAKMLLLFLIFLLLREVRVFFVLLVSVVLLRSNVGGIHFSTQRACITASVCVFLAMLALGRYFICSPICAGVLIVISNVMILKFAPVPSKQRPIYSLRRKKIFKIRGMCVLNLLFIFANLNRQYGNYVLWVLALQQLELIIATINCHEKA